MNESRKPLLILGAGRFAIDVADFAPESGNWIVEALVQNRDPQPESSFEGHRVLSIEEAFHRHPRAHAVCAVGSPKRIDLISHATRLGARFASLIHPFTRVSSLAEIGDGCIVAPGAIVSARTRVQSHTIINRASSIGHHSHIGEYVFIAPGVTVCGSSVVGDGAFIGAGAVVSDHVEIGAGAFVCAGAVVTRNVEAGARVMGVPARTPAGN